MTSRFSFYKKSCNGFKDIKSFSLYKCWFVLPQLPQAFICISNSTGYTSRLFRKCKPTIRQQIWGWGWNPASGLNKDQGSCLGRSLNKFIFEHLVSKWLFSYMRNGHRHTMHIPQKILVYCWELINAHNKWCWLLTSTFQFKSQGFSGVVNWRG